MWDLSLVDPDNRRPVDYAARERALAEIRQADPSPLMQTWEDGRIKLSVMNKMLHFRQSHAALFSDGAYLPLKVSGEQADHVTVFAREYENECLIVATPLALGAAGLESFCGGARRRSNAHRRGKTKIFQQALTGETISLRGKGPEGCDLEAAALFRNLPVAWLTSYTRSS